MCSSVDLLVANSVYTVSYDIEKHYSVSVLLELLLIGEVALAQSDISY